MPAAAGAPRGSPVTGGKRRRCYPAGRHSPTQPHVKPSISNRRLALLLGGLSMFGPFSIDTIFPAFPQIGAQMGADKLAMQQTISVYLLAYAAMSLVHGALSDALGRRRVILGGLAMFAIASAGFALSTSMPKLSRLAEKVDESAPGFMSPVSGARPARILA